MEKETNEVSRVHRNWIIDGYLGILIILVFWVTITFFVALKPMMSDGYMEHLATFQRGLVLLAWTMIVILLNWKSNLLWFRIPRQHVALRKFLGARVRVVGTEGLHLRIPFLFDFEPTFNPDLGLRTATLNVDCQGIVSEETFRPKEDVDGVSPKRGTSDSSIGAEWPIVYRAIVTDPYQYSFISDALDQVDARFEQAGRKLVKKLTPTEFRGRDINTLNRGLVRGIQNGVPGVDDDVNDMTIGGIGITIPSDSIASGRPTFSDDIESTLSVAFKKAVDRRENMADAINVEEMKAQLRKSEQYQAMNEADLNNIVLFLLGKKTGYDISFSGNVPHTFAVGGEFAGLAGGGKKK